MKCEGSHEHNPQSSSMEELWAGAILIHGKAPMPSMDFGSWPMVLAPHLVPSCWSALKEAKNTSNSCGTLLCVCKSLFELPCGAVGGPWLSLLVHGLAASAVDNPQSASRAWRQELQKKNELWVWCGKETNKKFYSEKGNCHFLGENAPWGGGNVGMMGMVVWHIWLWDVPELSHPHPFLWAFLFLSDETGRDTKTFLCFSLPKQKVSIEAPVWKTGISVSRNLFKLLSWGGWSFNFYCKGWD